MTIEEIKHEILDNIKDFLTNEAKAALVNWLKGTLLPAAKEVSDAFIAGLKESAKQEQGWNKFRDAVLLPTIIGGALWGIGKLLNQVAIKQ